MFFVIAFNHPFWMRLVIILTCARSQTHGEHILLYTWKKTPNRISQHDYPSFPRFESAHPHPAWTRAGHDPPARCPRFERPDSRPPRPGVAKNLRRRTGTSSIRVPDQKRMDLRPLRHRDFRHGGRADEFDRAGRFRAGLHSWILRRAAGGNCGTTWRERGPNRKAAWPDLQRGRNRICAEKEEIQTDDDCPRRNIHRRGTVAHPRDRRRGPQTRRADRAGYRHIAGWDSGQD